MKWFASFLFLLSCFFCGAQQYYETFTPANGLVDARVNKLIQDANGRILFLTRDGISIYDGQRFINHTKIGNTPISIVEDALLMADGNIRLATFSGNWITIKKNSDQPDTLLQKNIPETSSVIPISDNEYLVVSNYGLYINKNASLVPLLNNNYSVGKQKFIDHVAISKNTVVFNYFSDNRNSVYSCDKTKGIITDSLLDVPAYSMATDNKDNIFFCTPSGIKQLNASYLQKGKLKIEDPWFQKLLPPSFQVSKLFFDRQGNIWLINSLDGCCKINPTTGEKIMFSPKDGLFTGTTSIYQDHENNFWFIAKGKGVQKLVQTNFELFDKVGHNSMGAVSTILTSEDNDLVLFTEKDIVVAGEPAIRLNDPAYISYWQNSSWKFSSANTLSNNLKKEIIITDNAPAKIQHFPSPNITMDKKGNMLIAGNHFVLVQKNATAQRIALPYFADNIVADDNNNYWAFCRSNDIIKFNIQDNKLKKVSSFIYPQLEARFAVHWNKDTFLIASRSNGLLLAKVNEKSLSIIGQLTRAQGLSNDFVETLLRIDDDRIAAGTAAGLDIITFAGNDTLIENISARINHFEPILQLARDSKGNIYARTENHQVFKYDPNTFIASAYQPQAWLNQLAINGEIIPITKNSFTHIQNNFHFTVSSPSFINSRSINFLFELKGENSSWQQSGNKVDFEINNLEPGKYELSITIKYPGRIYKDKTITYGFTINPPFWKTWWFISILTIVFILSIYLIVRSYLQRQLQKKKIIMEKELAIEQERTRMARELHDGLGSMLSGVKHSFTAMQKQMKLDEEQENKFQYNIGKLNESIIELRDISHSMASESLLKYGLENSLRDYCNNISQPGEFNISFEALHTSNMHLSEEQSFHIFRIIQELIQNVIKHSGTSQAILQLSYNHNRLYITVEDNGKGFSMDEAKRKKGIGLKNIESRIKTLKGKMDLRTAPNEGTSVLIEIPC